MDTDGGQEVQERFARRLIKTPFKHLGDHGVQQPPRAKEEFRGLAVVLSGGLPFPHGSLEIREQLQQLGILRKLLYGISERLSRVALNGALKDVPKDRFGHRGISGR
jgi:hypothetical protein